MVTIRNVTMVKGVYNASEQLAAIHLQAIHLQGSHVFFGIVFLRIISNFSQAIS